MLSDKIHIVHSDSKIESLFTLFPLIISPYHRLLVYTHVESKDVMKISGACVILMRVFKGNKVYNDNFQKKREFVADFRKRFDRVVVLDDGAGGDSVHFEYMDLVDLYFKGKLLQDRTNYLRPMYGGQLFTDYYHYSFGVDDEKVKVRAAADDPQLLQKLRLSWNLGYGIYPIPGSTLTRLARSMVKFGWTDSLRPWFKYRYRNMLQRLERPAAINDKTAKIQARFGGNNLPKTVRYQRDLFLQKSSQNASILSGSLRSRYYKKEIRQVAAVLSPFGWGEVCFRDFETIVGGGLLIKANMDHLETWPNVYLNSITYLPVDWDGDNLIETVSAVADNINAYRNIIETAKDVYRKALLESDRRVCQFLAEATGQTI